MKVKLVKRYWCDFCKKAGLSAASMSKHEKHCTMNPNRECRVCKVLTLQQKPLSDLIMLLPVPTLSRDEYGCMNFQHGFYAAVDASVPKLRDTANGCPACMMAAFRQAHIPLPIVNGFSFTDEMKSVWANINEANAREDEYQSVYG